ncbi:MAG: polymerase subunit sigma [Geminicoccaceae bacterium]|nr:polymerase subunit sigma [Geminicoccaceae bacterium]
MLRPAPATTSASARCDASAPADVELLERCRAGDAVAFELIMRRYNRRLFRLARSIVRNAAEAEDVVQETYLRAYARGHEFRGPHGFSAWLARIAANEALGRLRARSRVVSLDDYVSSAGGDVDVRRIETITSPQLDPERLLPAAFEFGGARCDRIVAIVFARLRPAFAAARQGRPEPLD